MDVDVYGAFRSDHEKNAHQRPNEQAHCFSTVSGQAVGPTVPCGEDRMAAGADAEVHRFGKLLVSGALEHTDPQCLIGLPAFLLGAAAPVSDVMLKAAFAPFCAVADGPVLKKILTNMLGTVYLQWRYI